MGGVIGFRYESLPLLFEMHEVDPDDEADVFAKVQKFEQFYMNRANASLAK
jgi:hypothetical protein